MKLLRKLVLAAAVITAFANVANAQSLSDLLGKIKGNSGSGSDSGSTIGNILNGVAGALTGSDLKVKDLEGNWQASGPAVSFKGDNFLKKAGGEAAAATIESKIKPYFSKYGLNDATFTVNNDSTFVLTIKKVKLSGSIQQAEGEDNGVFQLNFQALKKVNLGKMNIYIQKSALKPNQMDLMFDATKLMRIVEGVGKISGISIAKTMSSLLSQYDGMCVGFQMSKVQ
ncbi:MAG: DUF4923 family protein [Muribaculaceae bacterium]|nr:DUF4923 family protein [Muribaculaceae bacterium]